MQNQIFPTYTPLGLSEYELMNFCLKGAFSEHYERYESSNTINQQNKKQKFEEKNREKIQMFNIWNNFIYLKLIIEKTFFLINHNTV